MEKIRIVLAGGSSSDWRPYRQQQWMGVVRRDPLASLTDRLHFDIDEDSYRACLADWPKTGRTRDVAIHSVLEAGAVAVAPPKTGESVEQE